MILNLGDVPASSVLRIPFHTFDSNGASVTITNLLAGDIEVFKDAGVTQRASDNGYTLADTDGIDFDGRAGLHGFSIDLADNSDAGFYAAGSWYWVAVDAITVDTQTVRFWAAVFRIVPAESAAGVPKVDVSHFGGTAGTFASGRPEANTTHIAGSAVSTSSAQIGVNVVSAGGTAWNSGAVTTGTFAAGAIDANAIAANAIGSSEFATTAVEEITAAIVAGGVPVSAGDGGMIDLTEFKAIDKEQITSLSSAVGISAGLLAKNPTCALITAEGANVRYWLDGSTPTASVGHVIYRNTSKMIAGNLAHAKFIEEAASAKLNITALGRKDRQSTTN